MSVLAHLLLAALAVLVSLDATAAQRSGTVPAACAAPDWSFALESLQSARSAIKARSRPKAVDRVRCGLKIMEDLKDAEDLDNCPACKSEYVNLLRDVAKYANDAARGAASKRYRDDLYSTEVETRLTLSTFLIDSGGDVLISRYWSQNFEELGDSLDKLDEGQRFHEQASLAQSKLLSQKSFDTWTKAVRSCEEWDFRHGENRDMAGLRKTLCVETCKKAVERLRRRAVAGTFRNKELFLERLDDFLPDTKQCPAVDAP